jgi:hypothetical protein
VSKNLSDIIANLRNYDEAPFNGQSPSIHVAEPWAATSVALVEWSGEKGGVPPGRRPLLLYLMTVGEALQFFGVDYDDQIASGEVDAMCAKLSYHVTQRNAQRLRRI